MQKEKMFTISECDRVIVTSQNLSDSFLFFCTQILSKYTYPYREIIYNLPKNTFVEHVFYNKPKSLIFNSIYFNVK
jgi:hypothetical protein